MPFVAASVVDTVVAVYTVAAFVLVGKEARLLQLIQTVAAVVVVVAWVYSIWLPLHSVLVPSTQEKKIKHHHLVRKDKNIPGPGHQIIVHTDSLHLE